MMLEVGTANMMYLTAPPGASTPVSPTPQSSAARPFQFLQAQ